MDMISEHWDQLILIGALIFHAAKSYALLSEGQKDIKQLQDELLRYTKWTQTQAEEIVKLRAEMDVVNRQITTQWEFMNGLRDRFNGHSKH
tara:strand:- start:282 stop:554 length:273 start_codon:yes stop_codon:yes gene_type:complete